MLHSTQDALMFALRLFLLVFIAQCFAATPDVDVVRDRCTRWHHSSMLRDTSVFVDGGVELFRNGGDTWLGFSKYIFEIDMSKPWDTTTNFTEKRIGRFGNSLMGANPPNMVRGGLFRGPANDTKLYTFGGSTFLANDTDPNWQPPSPDRYSLWSYDTATMTWGQYDVTSAIPRRPNWGAVTEAVALGIGFILNGQVDRGSSDVMYSMNEYVGGKLQMTNDQTTYLGGLLIIDMATRVAKNVSTESLGVPRVAGGLIHAKKIGKTTNGTLVTFGGMKSRDVSNNTFRNGALIEFDTVSVCDSWQEDKPIWFNQPASGEIPPPRIDFCVLPGVKSAKDSSSHHFYFHGGYDPVKNIMYDDVYILSLPSFTWTKLYSGPNPRFGHTCHTAGKRQMMAVGGSLNASMYGVETTGQMPLNLKSMKCDPLEGVQIFDLTTGTWGTSFSGSYGPEYQIPQKVVAIIGGSGDGNATMKSPVGGFVHPAIADMFNPPPPSSTQVSVPSSNSTVPAAASSQPSRRTNISAVAGGIIGAVVGSFVILGLAIFFKRRHSGSRLQENSASFQNNYPYDPKELPGEELYAKEMKGDMPSHELPADVPKGEPAELESPKAIHEKDSTPVESPVLPLGEFLDGDSTTPEESPVLEQSQILPRRAP